jgi:hypothetical protein
MKCETCGRDFTPAPDEERLMMLGQMGQVCETCARIQAPATAVAPAPLPTVNLEYAELFRADQFDKDNRLIRFVALPIKRKSIREMSREGLRKPKKNQLHTFVMSERSTQRRTTTPNVRLHTNLETFEEHHKAFWIRKLPSFWDPFTGVAEIEVPLNHIENVERQYDRVLIHLKDGGHIRLQYR